MSLTSDDNYKEPNNDIYYYYLNEFLLTCEWLISSLFLPMISAFKRETLFGTTTLLECMKIQAVFVKIVWAQKHHKKMTSSVAESAAQSCAFFLILYKERFC